MKSLKSQKSQNNSRISKVSKNFKNVANFDHKMTNFEATRNFKLVPRTLGPKKLHLDCSADFRTGLKVEIG